MRGALKTLAVTASTVSLAGVTPALSSADTSPLLPVGAPIRQAISETGTVTRTFPAAGTPVGNPMRGWAVTRWGNYNSGWSDPDSTVAHVYLGWGSLETKDQEFFTKTIDGTPVLDRALSRPGSKGNHVILRVFCQWDGSSKSFSDTACPSWLGSEVPFLQGENGKTSVDFGHPKFIRQAKELIAALGGRLNKNRQVYAVELGILGYYGEWHTFGFKPKPGVTPTRVTDETKRELIDAYKKAFPDKELVARYPTGGVTGKDGTLGFHNDFFWPGHGHSDQFDKAVQEGQSWKNGPIGGESYPGLSSTKQSEILTSGSGLKAIKEAHYSTLKPNTLQRRPLADGDPANTPQYRAEREGFVKMGDALGYNFRIKSMTMTPTPIAPRQLVPPGTSDVKVEIENVGNAPFYYDWEVLFATIDNDGATKGYFGSRGPRLSTVMPGETGTYSVTVPQAKTLGIRINQPGVWYSANSNPEGLKARRSYIEFANKIPVTPASWTSAGGLRGGMSVLGEVPATAPPVPTTKVVKKTFPAAESPTQNPMKGWVMEKWNHYNQDSFWNNWGDPDSTLAHLYVGWKDLEKNNQEFFTQQIEGQPALDWHMNRLGSAGRHVILRVICQWEGDEKVMGDSGCPAWLGNDVALIEGKNGKKLVDYNDPDFIREAKEMIAALGQRLKNDRRVYAIELGFLGYYGEWHTAGFEPLPGQPSPSISEATASELIDAYKKFIPNKKLMARYPFSGPESRDGALGFHNDFFWPGHGHSDQFDKAVQEGQKWKNGPIGGEGSPNLSPAQQSEIYANGSALEAIKKSGYSTMRPSKFQRFPATDESGKERPAPYNTPTYQAERAKFVEMGKAMGYNFRIEEVRVTTDVPFNSMTKVEVDIKNVGVAPFYYDWEVLVGRVDSNNVASAHSRMLGPRLSTIMPGQTVTFTEGRIPRSTIETGNYNIGIRINDPGVWDSSVPQDGRLKARNSYIEFANQMTVTPASWDPSGRLVGGWSLVGDLENWPR